MGLFSNNKKLCPICGSPTPRLLPTKIEDMPICKDCDKKIDLPDGMTNQMSLDGFRKYIAFYDENQALRDTFTETARYDYYYMRDAVVVDSAHGLFRLNKKDTGLVFEAACLKGFQIWEDRNTLFQGDREALRTFESDVPLRVTDIQYDIDNFTRNRQEYEHMEQMRRMMEERNRDRNDPPPSSYRYIPEPRFDVPGPVRKFYVEIIMDHPYWKGLKFEWDGPSFDTTYPSITNYMRDYQETLDQLYDLSCGLMSLLNPNAQEIHTALNGMPDQAQPPQSQSSGDVVGEITKFKMLLDSGVITEEEFAAKKRQLLGI